MRELTGPHLQAVILRQCLAGPHWGPWLSPVCLQRAAVRMHHVLSYPARCRASACLDAGWQRCSGLLLARCRMPTESGVEGQAAGEQE